MCVLSHVGPTRCIQWAVAYMAQDMKHTPHGLGLKWGDSLGMGGLSSWASLVPTSCLLNS